MRHSTLLLCVLLFPGMCRADRDSDAIARTLEEQARRAVREAGPSVACILVSRSEAYAKAPYWGMASRPEYPGQLGRFDAAAARKRVPAGARHRARVLQQIDDHDLSDPAIAPESYGSGMVIDRSGLVLTNAHVVRHATKVFVRLGKDRSSWADIHALDSYSDLAVLKLLDPPGGLKALPLGDGGRVERRQSILTLTNEWRPRPGVCELTVRTGVVSAVRQRAPLKTSEMKMRPDERDRRKLTIHHNGTLILINADGMPGCSGGAVLGLDGKVIGLTSALVGVTSDRGGFVIPFDTNMRRIIEVLKRGEEVEYGFLGVTLFGNAGDEDVLRTVVLRDVILGMPAERAGLRSNDRIIRIGDHRVKKATDLFLHIAMALAGTRLEIEVQRDRPYTFEVTLAKFDVHKQVIASKQPPALFGLRVDYTSILSQRQVFFRRWQQRPIPRGVIVREVVPDSPADRARLQPDKVITAVNGEAVTTPAQFYAKMARAGDSVELTYLNSREQPVRLTLNK
jgi:serine protease Do